MKTTTVTIQIGNSDDKLSQRQWSNYVNAVRSLVVQTGETHFSGGSKPDELWQNFCWVVVVPIDQIKDFMDALVVVRSKFGQDSIAFTVGGTSFV